MLAVTGIALLGAVGWLTLVIFASIVLITYAGLRIWCAKPRSRNGLFLAVLVACQCAPLFLFKYASFVLAQTDGILPSSLVSLGIPAGISFYTFQMVSFAVDSIRERKPLPNFLDFLNYAGFFPQIVAGPIERRQELLPQMQGFKLEWHRENLDEGFRWIALGFFFKAALADNFSELTRMANVENPWTIWMTTVLFGLQIYFDFSGYSFIAFGVALCFGVRLSLNFAAPYRSTSLIDFWRRWHITLSQWFRDYVYIPLGGNRRNSSLNLTLVFLLSGIWHGAGWNFILWGAIHAAGVHIERIWPKRILLPKPITWFLTMLVVMFSWLFFYETDLHRLAGKLACIANPASYCGGSLAAAFADWQLPVRPQLLIITCLALLVIAAESAVRNSKSDPYKLLRTTPALAVMIVLAVWLSPLEKTEFIYFAF